MKINIIAVRMKVGTINADRTKLVILHEPVSSVVDLFVSATHRNTRQ